MGDSLRVVNTIAALRLLRKADVAATSTLDTLGYFTPRDGGEARYMYDSADTTSSDNACSVIVGADGARFKLVTALEINVLQAGADPSGAADSTPAFNRAVASAAALVRAVTQVRVPKGTYKLNSATSKCLWVLDDSVSITGLSNTGEAGGGVPNLSRLTGRIQAGQQPGTKTMFKMGSTQPFLTTIRDPSEYLAELAVSSSTGGYGAIFASRSSDDPTPNMNCIGAGFMTLNDNVARPEVAWGTYHEQKRVNGAGAVLSSEMDFQNLGPTLDLDPFSIDDPYSINGPTAHDWRSCGGGFTGMNDISAHYVMLSTGARARRGIVAKAGSLTTKTTMAMPVDYAVTWFDGAGTSTGFLDGTAHVRTAKSNVASAGTNDQHYRKKANGVGATGINDVVHRAEFYGFNGSNNIALANVSVTQRTAVVNGLARASLDMAAFNADGGFTGLSINLAGDACVGPNVDNAISLGAPGFRWNTVFSSTGTINTSDERYKAEIAPIDDVLLDAMASVDYKQFKFRDALQAKGENARYHVGVIAQQLKAALEAQGVDPFKYGLLCYDAWQESTHTTPAQVIHHQVTYRDQQVDIKDADGNVVRSETIQVVDKEAWDEVIKEAVSEVVPAGDRYSVRYEELLCLEAALQRRMTARLEAAILALDTKLQQLAGQ